MLCAKNLTIKFGGIKALDNLSVTVANNTITSLIGPNGSGKTSFLNCISRLYQPSYGDILFQGKSLLQFPVDKVCSAGIARTFQNVALFNSMTVLENILLGMHSRIKSNYFLDMLGIKRQKTLSEQYLDECHRLISRLQLDKYTHFPVITLTLALQKRVELARALASNPILLLLDEPASGLNHDEVQQMAEVILSIKQQSPITILLIEHNMKLVMQLSDHIIVLNQGKMIAQGTPIEIQNDRNVIKTYLGEPS